MPFRVSDLLLRLAPLVTIGLVALGLIANLAGGPRPGHPALALPTALAYATLAILWHRDRTRPDHRPHPRLTLVLGLAIAAACLLTLADRWTGLFGGNLDAALRAAELGALGLNGHVSSKSLLFIATCALALLGARRSRLLSSLFVLALLAICNVAVVDLAMSGALWDRELSVWSTLAAFTLTLAAALRLRERSVFSALFLPGAAGMALRLMAGLSLVMPMLAGWIYAYLMAPKPQEADLIAQLFGGLGWVMFQMTFLLGFIIASELRKTEATAQQDLLTGLLNRAGIAAAVRGIKADVAGVLMAEVDGFAGLNDALGNPKGDALLRDIAAAIRAEMPEDDAIIGRLWNDEFLIVVPNLVLPQLEQRAEALRLAVSRLPPLATGEGLHHPRLTVGCATFIPSRMSFDALLNDADSALHWVTTARRDWFTEAEDEDHAPPTSPPEDASAVPAAAGRAG